MLAGEEHDGPAESYGEKRVSELDFENLCGNQNLAWKHVFPHSFLPDRHFLHQQALIHH